MLEVKPLEIEAPKTVSTAPVSNPSGSVLARTIHGFWGGVFENKNNILTELPLLSEELQGRLFDNASLYPSIIYNGRFALDNSPHFPHRLTDCSRGSPTRLAS